jgi:hypothetical protein
MLLRFWHFVENKKNRAILSWLGGGAVVVTAGLWAAFIFFFSEQSKHHPPGVDVQATCGGVAVGGSVTGSNIASGTTSISDCSTNPQWRTQP